MTSQVRGPKTRRFGAFELNTDTMELRGNGKPIPLTGQAASVLLALLERPGELVTREELRTRLWPDGTWVDFDHGLGNAVARLRQALGDSADRPRFVETLPRRGFRLIAPVESTREAHNLAAPPPKALPRRGWMAAATILLLAAGTAAWLVRGPAEPPPEMSIVVLPLANGTGDAADDYFVEGMSDDLINQLARLAPGRLHVVARTSAMRFRGQQPSLETLRRELGAEFALLGNVRREGGRVRVAVQMIQLSDGTVLWSDAYERERGGVIEIQAGLARRVAIALSLRLAAGSRGRPERATANPDAYDAYLRGLWFWNQKTPEGVARSVSYFQEALRLDSEYAEANAALAAAYHFSGAMGLLSHDEAREKTRAAAERALWLDPSNGEALAVLAESRFRFGQETAGVEGMFRRAIELRPGSVASRHWFGMFLAIEGRGAEALEQLELARELDPLAQHLQTDYAAVLYHVGQHDEARVHLARARELDPAFPKTFLVESAWLEQESRYAEAAAAMERAVTLSPKTPKYVAALAEIYLKAGRAAEARRAFDELHLLARTAHVPTETLRALSEKISGTRMAAPAS